MVRSYRRIIIGVLAVLAVLSLLSSPALNGLYKQHTMSAAAQVQGGTTSTNIDPRFPPSPTFTPTEIQTFMANATNAPGIKAWSDKWQFNYMDFSGTSVPSPKWEYMILHLYLPSNVPAPVACDIGWEAIVTFDLATRHIVSSYYPTVLANHCHATVVLGDPESITQVDTSPANNLLPAAYAIATNPAFSVATQDDVLTNSLYGTLAYITTPSYNGIYSHMDGYVGQLVNARFSPTPGANYAQAGWVIASAGCTVNCGDQVQANSKVVVWADSSVSPFTNAAHVVDYPNTWAWVNDQTELGEILCNGGSNYIIAIGYGGKIFNHTTGVACGTTQQGSEISNSVFFENWNTVASSNWAGDITGAVKAWTAEELRNSQSVWSYWLSSNNKDKLCNSSTPVASNAMTGNIQNNGVVNWTPLSNIPAGC